MVNCYKNFFSGDQGTGTTGLKERPVISITPRHHCCLGWHRRNQVKRNSYFRPKDRSDGLNTGKYFDYLDVILFLFLLQ